MIAKMVKTIRYKDFEVQIRDELEKAKEISDDIKADPNLPPLKDPTSTEHVVELVKVDPGVAILRSWQRLETKISDLTLRVLGSWEMATGSQIMRDSRTGEFIGRSRSPESVMKRLLQQENISSEDYELFRRLRTIRNEAVHFGSDDRRRSVTAAEAVEYDELIQTMIRRLDAIARDSQPEPA